VLPSSFNCYRALFAKLDAESTKFLSRSLSQSQRLSSAVRKQPGVRWLLQWWMGSRGILRMNRGSVIAGSCLATFLVTHKISEKQPRGVSYTSTLCFHNSSILAPQKPGRSCLMAAFCSPKERVD